MEFLNCFSSHIVCAAEKPTDDEVKHHRSPKKHGSNPYSERGLDRFALVSAELEAKRKRLVAQLGSQLSFVRFAMGSNHRDWIPVIVCPTLSKAEIHALKRSATRLIADDRDVKSSAGFRRTRSSRVSDSKTTIQDHSSLTSNEVKNVLHHDHDQQPAHTSVAHAEDAQNPQVGTLDYLLAASERCLWVAAFMCSIAADVISDVFLSKWPASDAPPQKRILPSTSRANQESESPSSNMSSSMNLPSLPRIRAPAGISTAKDIKAMTPSHAQAPKVHKRCKSPGFSTAPSTPRDSRQAKRAFQASVSFPTTTRLQDEAPRSGTTKDPKLHGLLSLPKMSQTPEHVTRRSATAMAKEALQKKERKERSRKLGQALTGAGLALGLGSLVMGYIPAIMCVVCWWYALPSLREAVGDKPYVKRHQH